MKEKLSRLDAGTPRVGEEEGARVAGAGAEARSESALLEHAEQVRALGIVEGQAILTFIDDGQ